MTTHHHPTCSELCRAHLFEGVLEPLDTALLSRKRVACTRERAEALELESTSDGQIRQMLQARYESSRARVIDR